MAFKDIPIKRKLTALFLLTSGAVVLLTCASYFAYEYLTFRQTTLGQLSTLGEVIAANSTAAVAFGNERDAGEILAALKAERHIVAAGLYDRDGKLFSRYPAHLSADAFPAAPERDGYRFDSSHLAGFQPVAQVGNKRLGTLYLKSDMGAMYERFRLYSGIVAAVVVASLLVAFMVSTGLQRHISEPILTLATTAHAIADRGDYSVRATKGAEDEVGLLTDAFNQMLTRIDEQDRALRESEERLNLALMSSGVGTWSWNVVENSIIWDDYIHPLFGLKPKTFPGRFEDLLHLVHPNDRDHVKEVVAETLENDAPYDTEYQVIWPDGTMRVLAARGKVVFRDPAGKPVRMTGVCWDMTEEKRAGEQLRTLLAELERSNKELEQFAYVASHDLQEPLRMVSSYTQLLEQRYRDKLDGDAREFINYAVDGARRMQRLINDLLEFSRVSTRAKRLEPVDANEVLGTVRANLSAAIEDGGALVTNEQLPTVMVDPTQLGQLLQNLIGNAIKFKGAESPRVHIAACEGEGEWVFTVRDNGVGIDPEYFDRIFVIFQRLHVTAEYPGTGIGLAVCKRIAERHGGRIWVESEPGNGATFSFSIPKSSGAQES
jgi:PAS domain S-box-containing protein